MVKTIWRLALQFKFISICTFYNCSYKNISFINCYLYHMLLEWNHQKKVNNKELFIIFSSLQCKIYVICHCHRVRWNWKFSHFLRFPLSLSLFIHLKWLKARLILTNKIDHKTTYPWAQLPNNRSYQFIKYNST